jgi:hypothetical protein
MHGIAQVIFLIAGSIALATVLPLPAVFGIACLVAVLAPTAPSKPKAPKVKDEFDL